MPARKSTKSSSVAAVKPVAIRKRKSKTPVETSASADLFLTQDIDEPATFTLELATKTQVKVDFAMVVMDIAKFVFGGGKA